MDHDTAPQTREPTKAVVVGTPARTAGILGSAAQFDGTQYVELEGGPPLERDRPFSFAVWLNAATAPSSVVVSKMEGDARARGVDVIWYKSQAWVNLVHRWGENSITVVTEPKFARTWHHLAVAYDGSGKAAGVRIHVDGAPVPLHVHRDNLDGTVHTEEPWRIAWKATGVGFEGALDEARLYDRALSAEEIEDLYWSELTHGVFATPAAERSRFQKDKLDEYYVERIGAPDIRAQQEELARLRSAREEVAGAILALSVMRDMDQPRETFLLVRGQYDAAGERVTPGVPAALGRLPEDPGPGRLALARWLTGDENPITPRVVVNRYWQLLFGEGLVRTPNDFGSQGQLPTHPELLDWLAVRFRSNGWDVKDLVRLIVTSTAYRQSSDFTPELLARDPQNRLLARGPRYRLPAELIRDQALAVSGLLQQRLGGPSVKPYQPPGLWEAVSYNGEETYVADHGEALHRRGLYTYWKRQAPPPEMLNFDAPTREVCTIGRPRTNTPLQALGLLNDVAYVEAARRLAERILHEAPEGPRERARWGFQLATGRSPDPAEVEALQALYDRQLAEYRRDPDAAKSLLAVGEAPAAAGLDPREVAAWTTVSGVLLNLDEVITQH